MSLGERKSGGQPRATAPELFAGKENIGGGEVQLG